MSTANDDERVRALERYGVLEAPPRRELVALVELAARFTGVPMATINLITDAEQVQVATYGFGGQRSRREDSLCANVVEEERPIYLEDVRLDERFADNPFTTGELGTVRFYGAHPLVTPEGVTIGTLCVFDDETRPVTPQVSEALETLAERVVDVLELEYTSRQLARANERLGAFAGQVSHDLRNPLAAVRMSLEMLRDELGDADPSLLGLLERAERGTSRMDAMIGELLTFARVGKPELADVDLTSVVNDVIEDLIGVAQPGQIVVAPLPSVRGDAVQLRVLLQNLVANAVKFSPPGSTVEVSAAHTGGAWRLSVTDRGPGIPAADRERVFDPLVRLDTRIPGSGIGLATCRRIVEAHGGRIGVAESEAGGASLWFELPSESESR